MGKLEKQRFVCLDCETTGLDTANDRIIELAIIEFDFSGHYQSFETLIDPECSIPEESVVIHNITDSMVQGKPKIKEVLPKFLEILGKHIIVGHGVSFDIDVIDATAQREGVPCTIKKNRFMDTLRLARLYGRSPSNSLEFLRKHFHIDAEIAHRAMSDVIVNIEVFKKLVYGFRTTEEVFRALSKPVLLKEMPLGQHKGRLFRDVPLSYLQWAVRKDFDQDLLYSIRTELKKRKQKGESFSNSPFADL